MPDPRAAAGRPARRCYSPSGCSTAATRAWLYRDPDARDGLRAKFRVFNATHLMNTVLGKDLDFFTESYHMIAYQRESLIPWTLNAQRYGIN